MACGCEGAKCKVEPVARLHGTANCYTNYGCRCDACGEAKREYAKARYKSRREAGLEPGDRRHGTANGYANRGCRCDACCEAWREYGKAYHESKRDARLERMKVYYAANQEAVLERVKAYQAANPDVCHAAHVRRRARKKGATIGPAFTRQQVWDRDNGTCHLCKQPADPSNWHVEHVVPLARGGAHSFDNCAVSCPPCNRRKGTRLLDELDTACMMDAVSN